MITLATVVTKSCLKDFLLMQKSFGLYHEDYRIIVAADRYCYEYLGGNFKNIVVNLCKDLNDGNHVSSDPDAKKSFINVINEKFKIALDQKISSNNLLLWCDVDHIFVNKIEDDVLHKSSYFDAALTPHFSDGFADETTVGFFNCGFALISNINFLKTWKRIYDNHETLELYYEQKPLEVCIRSFNTLNLPISYNFGWWKLMSSKYGGNIAKITAGDDIKWENKPLVNFHFHLFKNDNHHFDKSQLVNYFKQLLLKRNRTEDQILLYEIERLSNEDI